MPTAGHTPGPWPKDYVHEAVRHIARNCDFIVSRSDPDFSGWDRYNGDSDLIAEAPKMLAELKVAAEVLAAIDEAEAWVLPRGLVLSIARTISRAEGRES